MMVNVITYLTLIIDGENAVIGISVPCFMSSLADVNQLINDLVKAKNTVFPSGGADHKSQMEKIEARDAK